MPETLLTAKKMCLLYQHRYQKWNPRFVGNVYSAQFRMSTVPLTDTAFPAFKRTTVGGNLPKSKESAITPG